MVKIKTDYQPKTEFLKQKIAEAPQVGNKQYIQTLCDLEDAAFKYQVLHESVPMYGSYGFLHPKQFGAYRKEYFEILKELNYHDYIRVIANEIFDPAMYGPGGRCVPFKLEDFDEDTKTELMNIRNGIVEEKIQRSKMIRDLDRK